MVRARGLKSSLLSGRSQPRFVLVLKNTLKHSASMYSIWRGCWAGAGPGIQGPVHRGGSGPAIFQQYVLSRPVHQFVLVLAAALSADFCTAYRSLARMERVGPLWSWAHIRRYFIRADDDHKKLWYWRHQWLAREPWPVPGS